MRRIIAICLFLAFARTARANDLKQSTATTITFNLTNADGTPATAQTITGITWRITKHSDTIPATTSTGSCTASAGTHDCAEIGHGAYQMEIPAADVDILGRFTVTWNETGSVAYSRTFMVIASASWDINVAGSILTAAVVSDAVWDEDIVAAHNTADTAGEILDGDTTGGVNVTSGTITTYTGNTPQTGDAFARLGAPAGASVSADIAILRRPIITTGTAQSGTATTIQLASAESFADDIPNAHIQACIVGGTGAGQCRLVTDYTGATDTATVDQAWTTNPDATSVYVLVPQSRVYLTNGSIGAAQFAAGAIDAAAIAADAIGASELADAALDPAKIVISASTFSYPLGPFVSSTDHVTRITTGTPACTRSTDAPNNGTALNGSTTISAVGAQGRSEVTFASADTTATDYFVINCTLTNADPVETTFFVQQP